MKNIEVGAIGLETCCPCNKSVLKKVLAVESRLSSICATGVAQLIGYDLEDIGALASEGVVVEIGRACARTVLGCGIGRGSEEIWNLTYL